MQSWICHKLMKPGRLRRGIVIFFLIFTFADLTLIDLLSPQSCSDDGFGALAILGELQSDGDCTEKTFIGAADDSHQEKSSEPDCTGEDCFCCCAHVMPAFPAPPQQLEAKSHVTAARLAPLPSSPPDNPFHPPRFS